MNVKGMMRMARVRGSELVRLGFPRQPAMQPALRPVVLSREEFHELRFVHHWTGLGSDTGAGPAHGTTVWVAATRTGECGAVGFDWCELQAGVLGIVDPFGITSNVYPVNSSGAAIEAGERLRMLLGAVHMLRWQERVQEQMPKAATARSA